MNAYENKTEALRRKHLEDLSDEDNAYEERNILIEWLDKPQLDYEDINHKLEYYDEETIFNIAKALKCNPVKAEVKFQEISFALEALRELKDEFYKIMDA